MLYQLPGCPIPLARARWSGRRIYDDQKNTKNYLRQLLIHQHKNTRLYSGPLLLNATFFMSIPKSKRNIAGRYHVFKPDLDNLLKMVCDICSEILFNDDCTISEICTKKIYDNNPRTEFYIEELK